MTDETEAEETIEVDVEPRELILDTPDGQLAIPCLETLAEALGETPLAFWANEKGLFWLTPRRRWESIEVDTGPKRLRN